MRNKEPGDNKPPSRAHQRWAAIAALAIIAVLVTLAACGGEQVSTPVKPPVATGPTATAANSSTAQSTGTPTPTAEPTATPAKPPLTKGPEPTSPPARDSGPPHGQAIFQANCAVCHGTDGEGQPDWHVKKPDGILPAPPLNGDGHTWHHGDGTLYTYVSKGGKFYEAPEIPSFKSGMPGFGETLSREEIIAVIKYLKSLWGDKVAEGFGLMKRESQALVSENDPFPPAAP